MTRQTTYILTIGLLVGVASAWGQTPPPTAKPNSTNASSSDVDKLFKNEKEKFSYALGMSWGAGLKGRLKQQDVDIDQEAFARGFMDNLGKGPSLITDAQEHEIINQFQMKVRAEQKAKAEKAKEEGEAFLAKKKTEQGVVTLPSGLEYKILTEGHGDSPTLQDEVSVNYRGKLMDGTEFDSSYKRNAPATFRVTGVVKGWTEALQLMKPGAKWELYIPPNLAYGERPPPGSGIPPDSTLIFDIELLSVKHPPAPSPVHPGATPAPPTALHPTSVPLTSDIIKVPSEEERKKGAQIETIKADDLEKERAKAAASGTNTSVLNTNK